MTAKSGLGGEGGVRIGYLRCKFSSSLVALQHHVMGTRGIHGSVGFDA